MERRFIGNACIFKPAEIPDLLNTRSKPFPFRITDPYYKQVTELDELTRMQYIDLHTWLPGDILTKADKMTISNSLELRVPFLDHQLFELAASLPTRYKVNDKNTKIALREAFKDLLSSTTVNRPKMGFPVPTREWIRRRDFQDLFFDLLSTAGGNYFNKKTVNELFRTHFMKRADYSRRLWTVLIFLLWHYTFMEKKSGDSKIFK